MIKTLLILFITLHLSLNKRVIQKIKLSRLKNWQYLTKFGGDVGRNDYNIKFRILGKENEPVRELPIKMELFLDDQWRDVVNTQECDKSQFTKRIETFNVPTDGTHSRVFQGYLQQQARTHVWYYAISDCSGELRNGFSASELRNVYIEVDFHILNSGDTEFSTEYRGIVPLQAIMTIIDTIILAINLKLMRDKHKKYEEFSLPQFFLIITLLVETLSYLSNLIHLIVYSYNGYGVAAFHLISLLLQVCSSFGLTMILILISWGWSINFIKFDSFEIFLPFSLLIGFFEVFIVGIGFIDNDAHSKNHHYEGWVGWVASVMFLALFAYFFKGILETYKKSNTKVQEFTILLGIYGTLYFLSFPILQSVNVIVARYLRHKVMEIGTMIFRTGAIALLSMLFISKNSIYASISYDNQSFLDRNKFD